jgi:DNA-binding response OmpR family regulator
MARILIVDPSPEISELIAHVVQRLGHEPVRIRRPEREADVSVDLALVEPAFPETLAVARRLRDAHPGLPIVCLSIQAKSEADVTPLAPVAYLMKPFGLRELENVVRMTVGDSVAPAA